MASVSNFKYFNLKHVIAKVFMTSLTSKLFLPFHFVEKVVQSRKEVRYLATLVVTLSALQYSVFAIHRQILADLGDRKNDLLHTAVRAHYLLRKQ